MADPQTARKNMVDGQIHTHGVIIPGILEAFESVPREKFVPELFEKIAYNDEDIALGHDRYLMEPAVHARLIQALELKPEDVVLDIGGGTGYGAAILSSLASTVVVLESEKEFTDKASKLWEGLGLCNVAVFSGALEKGHPENAPYDSVIINGAVDNVPEEILQQLANGGRLVAIVKEPGNIMGDARLFYKDEDGHVSSHSLFSAGTPYLSGFAPRPDFRF